MRCGSARQFSVEASRIEWRAHVWPFQLFAITPAFIRSLFELIPTFITRKSSQTGIALAPVVTFAAISTYPIAKEASMRRTLAVLILALAVTVPAFAQTMFQGRIDITVLDSQGSAVPGALVETTGPIPASQTTDAAGEAHFLNLSPGNYTVAASVTGFNSYRGDRVEVGGGRSVPLKIALTVSGVAAQVMSVMVFP